MTAGRRAGDRLPHVSPHSAFPVAMVATFLAALLVPGLAAAQQDTTRARADTLHAGAAARDTAVQDTIPQDTVLTPRERALLRLRAMPRIPVQRDTLAADSLATDSVAADTVAADSLTRAGADSVRLDSLGRPLPADRGRTGEVVVDSLAGDSARLRPQPPDTAGRPVGGPAWLRNAAGQGAQRANDPGLVRESDVRAQLDSLRGYVATEYRGDAATFEADSNQLHLTGQSRVAREGNSLETDSLLVYDGDTQVVCGYGQPVLSGEQEPVTSKRVCFDIERDVGMAEGARTRFTRQATWFVLGANNQVFVLAKDSTNTLYGRKTEFTSCDLEHPHYTFEAQSLKMVDGGMMVARDVTLKFEDVPVFWLPWMISPVHRGRHSGLLMPQFGVNDIVRNNAGYSRRISNVGFYWAINDYASARGTFEWWANNWTAVEGALTYYWRRQFLQGSLTTKQYWRQREGVATGREFTLNTNNSWQPDERTRIQLNARYASSTDFVRTNTFDPNELNQSIRSSASANRSFNWGSVTLGADRQQQLSTDQVDMTLPSLQLSLSPLTLYSGDGWDVTWRGSGNANRKLRDVKEAELARVRDSETLRSGMNQTLSVGRFSLGQSVDYTKEILGAKPVVPETTDTVALAEETSETMNWSASLGFQQNLWIGTTLSPSVSVSGTRVRNEDTRFWADTLHQSGPSDFIAQPLRISAGASLTTAIYGFWPGFANFSRIRHKIAPTLRWTYSPEPTTTTLQDSVFGTRNLRERNQLTLSFSQTFEAKIESDDTASTDSVEVGQPGEPRRLPQSQKITLLALNTSTPLIYDFVAAKEDQRGFQTTRITNSIRSDLLRGLQVSMTHDLFEVGESPGDGGLPPRTFKPFLTNLSASFSIDNDFWLFRFLGLTSGAGGSQEEAGRDTTNERTGMQPGVGAEASADRRTGGLGGVVPGGGGQETGPSVRGAPGRWQAQLSYSLQRTRPTATSSDAGSQLLRATVNFDPTEHWSVRWTTSYSFTDHQFADHILTLSRDLHRWTANFDFLKAQNGNFAFQFRVELRDQPDLKLDYDQRQRGAGTIEGQQRPIGGAG